MHLPRFVPGRWAWFSLVLLLALAVLGACSDRDSTSSPTEARLRKAAREQSEALFEGDATAAYGFFSNECKKTVSLRDYRRELSVARTAFRAFTGADLEDVEVERVDVRNFMPDKAEVLVAVKTPPESAIELGDDEWQEWIYEDGRWALTDCQASMFGG